MTLPFPPNMVDLRVPLGPLTLNNPIMAAAGTFGYGVEFSRAVRLERIGALITKTLTFRPRQGHPPPRLVETPAGMLNAVGLQNVGLTAFLSEILPQLRQHAVPVIVSVLGESPEELAGMVRQLDQADGVDGIELNLSCPNLPKASSELRVESSGFTQRGTRNPELVTPNSQLVFQRMVAQDPEATEAMVRAARGQTGKPLIAKLSPDVTDLAPIAQAAERAGATALALVNTFVGMSLDPVSRRSRLGMMTGGVSGPAIRPLAVYRVWYTARTVRLPIIGLGGIVRAEDAIEFILAGATAVAVGTAHFADPRAAARIARGLERYCARHRIRSLDEIRGAINQTSGSRVEVQG